MAKYIFGSKISEEDWLEVACSGDVVDMHGHRVSISEDDMDQWLVAYNENVRGQGIPITYDHPKSGGIAAGWVDGFKKGPVREILGQERQTFLMKPKWTPKGLTSIKDGDFKYFSLEIMPGNQLRAVSLVNFPAIKGLNSATEPVQFSEGTYFLQEFYMPEDKQSYQEDGVRCPKCDAVIKPGADVCPGCGADLTKKEKTAVADKDVSLEEFRSLQEAVKTLGEQKKLVDESFATLKTENEVRQATIVQLTENNKTLTEQTAALASINNMMRLHEKVTDLMKLGDGTNRVILPAYEQKIINLLLLTDSVEQEVEVLGLLQDLASGDALVEFGEVGTSEVPNFRSNGTDDERKKINEKALKLSDSGEISYREALIKLSAQEEK